MTKFNVGDIIVGKPNNGYAITGGGVQCEVVGLVTPTAYNANSDIEVRVRGARERDTWKVESKHFDLVSRNAKKAEVEAETKAKTESVLDSKVSVEYDEELKCTFIQVGDATIALNVKPDKVAYTVKHPNDEFHEEIAKSVAFYRLSKKGNLK